MGAFQACSQAVFCHSGSEPPRLLGLSAREQWDISGREGPSQAPHLFVVLGLHARQAAAQEQHARIRRLQPSAMESARRLIWVMSVGQA